jgi:hypothetical protein
MTMKPPEHSSIAPEQSLAWATRAGGFLPLSLWVLALIVYCLPASTWGPDQSVNWMQAAALGHDGQFPQYGLFNSWGFRNPNGLVLVLAPFVAVGGHPYAISALLAGVQIGVLVLCVRQIAQFFPQVRDVVGVYYVVAPLAIATPLFGFTVTDPWAQYLGRTLCCGFLLTLLMLIRVPRGACSKAALSGIFGFLFVLLPSVHLGLMVLLPAAGIAIIWMRRKDQVSLLSLGVGALLAGLISWLPWLISSSEVAVAMAEHRTSRDGGGPSWHAVVPLWDFLAITASANEGSWTPVDTGLLSAPTLTLLTGIGLVRVALVLALGGALVRLAWQKPGPARVLLLVFIGIMSAFSCIALLGAQSRHDYGMMLAQPGLLLLGVGGFYALKQSGDLNKPMVRLATALLVMILFGAGALGTWASKSDYLESPQFSLADVPLTEKSALLDAFSAQSPREAPPRVAVRLYGFPEIFWFIDLFSEIDRQGFYDQNAFYRTYLERVHPDLDATFVGIDENPTHIIQNARAPSPFVGPANEIVSTKKLSLWERVELPTPASFD